MNQLVRSVVASFMIVVSWGFAVGQAPTSDVIVKMDAGLDSILAADAKLEMLKAEGFEGGEGPVWMPDGKPGYLLFSDIPGNRIYKWTPTCAKYPCPPDGGALSVFLEHAGYKDASKTGKVDAAGAPLRGTNGLARDRQGRLVMDTTGDRAVERLEKTATEARWPIATMESA